MDIRWERGFSLSQALDMLDDDEEIGEEVEKIFITPPEVNAGSDEDSADDDEGGMVYNLTGRQLRAAAEIQLTNNDRIPGVSENSEESPGAILDALQQRSLDPKIPETSSVASKVGPHREWINDRLKSKSNPVWIRGDLEPSSRVFPEADYSQYKNMSAVELFELFFDEDIFQHLTEHTQRYSQYKNEVDPGITNSEIRCFIAILILSGYNHLPSKKMYWDMNNDVHNNMVANVMRRNRFLKIQKFIHVADNTQINEMDKAWKLRPLMDKLKHKCLEHFQPIKNLSFDESMVKYYGRHGCKQFIRGKPIRFGYKMWSLNTNDGHLVNFDLYQGKDPRGKADFEKLFGKCSSPLVLMLQELHKQDLPYIIHIDNLFTGLNLLSYLKYLGFGAVGTIRENRIPRSCPLTCKKQFQKKPCGDIEYIIEKNDGILLVRWMDNSVVTIASTNNGVHPLSSVKRYSQQEKKHVMISRPNCIASYNINMGGTDLMDQGIANYRIGIRGKKWYWPLFTWLIDVAVQNAWFLCRKDRNISNLEFRREIVQVYLSRYGVSPKMPGRISITKNILPDIRFDRMDHFVVSCQRRRCAGQGCKSFGRTMCQKCDVGLCVSCFASYHTK